MSQPFAVVIGKRLLILPWGPLDFYKNITSWEICSEPSLSDHRHILFTLGGSLSVRLPWNPRGTNWGSFREGLWVRLKRGPQMNMKHGAGWGLAVYWIQEALISACEDNLPLRPVKTGRQSLKWTSELQSLRRRVRRLFNKCRIDNNPHNWELY